MIKNNLIFEDSSAEIEERHSKAFFACYTTGCFNGQERWRFLGIYLYIQTGHSTCTFPSTRLPEYLPILWTLKEEPGVFCLNVTLAGRNSTVQTEDLS